MKKYIERFSPYLYDFVKKKVDLSEFLSTEIGCNLRWYEPKVAAGTACPMPNHKDSNPSFRIKYIEESGIWIFHCLGCGSKGTIVDFCMEYYSLDSSAEAVLFICDKFGFKKTDLVVTDSIKDVTKRVNLQKKIGCAHVVAARQCFTLLKKDYIKYNKWVAEAYQEMNKALDEEDLGVVDRIAFEASGKIQEK
jgi:DNA primase